MRLMRHFLAASSVAALTVSTPSKAQPPQPPQEPASGDGIVVTGSRIPRPDLNEASPVAVIGAEQINAVGATSVEQVLTAMPQVVASDNQFAGYGGGTAFVDLRGLGPSRTLVLVNGRRYVVNGSAQVVDLNTIPEPLVERIEVVTGGRSAVYGSDALAGVVNFILKDHFEGVQVGTHAGVTTRGDGSEYRANVTLGVNAAGGRGNVTVYGDYYRRHAIFGDDRDYARVALGDSGDGQLVEGGSSAIVGGRLVGLPGGSRQFNPDGSLSPYSFDANHFNFNPPLNLQVPEEQKTVALFGHYDFSDRVTAFVESEYVDTMTATQGPPTAAFGETVSIQVNSPFLPSSSQNYLRQFDPRNTGYISAGLRRRFVEFGNLLSPYSRQAFRIVAGLRGALGDGWKYEVYYNYAQNKGIMQRLNTLSRSRLDEALNTVFADPQTLGSATPTLSPFPLAGVAGGGELVCANPVARAQGCVPANIFGANRLSPAAIGYLSEPLSQRQQTGRHIVAATVTNAELFRLPFGGPVGVALGAEYRRESARFDPDDPTRRGDAFNFDPQDPLRGHYDVKEGFGELNAVLLEDKPLIHRLEANAAARYAHYSTKGTGNVLSYAAGLSYAPIQDINFRGQYQKATRGPNIGELFSANTITAAGGTDPCNNVAPGSQLAQRCIATGVPTSLIGTLLDPNPQLRVLQGGNPNLDAETSTTWTAGIVLKPRFVRGLSLTADYFDIKIDKFVGTIGGPNILALCYQQGLPAYCSLISRSPVGGNIIEIRDVTANAAGYATSGFDFDLQFRRRLGGGGSPSSLSLQARFTYLRDRTLTPIAALPDVQNKCAGKFGVTCGDPSPRLKGQASVAWERNKVGAFLQWIYLGHVRDDGGLGFPVAVPKIPSFSYFNASLQFHLPRNTELTLGMINILDKLPPILGDNSAANWANSWPATYDPIGRRVFINLTTKF